MDRVTFLKEMQDVLQCEDELDFNMKLKDIEEWDSLSIMATIEFLDLNFGVKTKIVDYTQMKTVEDLAQKAGI